MKYRRNEKGAALLLALGFAALLLVLIMGFVTNALIERKVASTNADRTEAKNIAMSALNRAIASMRYLSDTIIEDTGLHRFDNIVSKNTEEVYSSAPHHGAYITAIPRYPDPFNNSNTAGNFDDEDLPKFSGLDDVFVERTYNSQTHYVLKNGRDLYLYKYPVNPNYDYNENSVDALPPIADRPDVLIPRQPQWQYVRQNGFNPPWRPSNPRSPVIGRYLYAVLPDMGKFSADAFWHNTRLSSGNIVDSAIARAGREIREFPGNNFMPLMRAAFDSDVDFSHSVTSNDIFYYTNGEPFYRTSQAFDAVMRAGQVASSLSDSDIADSAFELTNMVEPLLFNINATGTGLETNNSNEYFRQGTNYRGTSSTPQPRRPMLRLFQGPSTNITLHNDFTTILNSTNPVTALQNAVPYLNKIDSEPTVRNQIAANIIEFFRTSGNVVGYDATTPTNTTYTGNRMTPYINEFTLSLSNLTAANVSVVQDTSDPTPNVITTTITNPNVTFSANFELYNIFGSTFNPGANDVITFTGDIEIAFELVDSSYSGTGTTTPLESENHTLIVTISNAAAQDWQDPNSTANLWQDTGTFTSTITPALSISYTGEQTCRLRARVVSISNGTITLRRNGHVIDFVKNISIAETATTPNKPEVFSANLSLGTTSIGTVTPANELSYQAVDPFCNLDASDTTLWNCSNNATINAANTSSNISNILTANVTRLQQIAADLFPTNGSANYSNISLADLGLISKGRPGETLKIHSVGATETNSITNVNDITKTTTASGACSCGANPCSSHQGSATSGDGGLLDQMTTMIDTTPQLIDINTRSVAVWKSLLSNIRGDVTAANPTPNYILDATNAENLARKISWRIRNDNAFFKSRSGFIAVFNASLGSVNSIPATVSSTNAALTDREKQIILGKILPLCKTEDYPEFIQVIVVAQKIKDIGGYDGDNPSNNFVVGDNFGSFEYGRDQIVSEVRLLAKIRRRVDTSATPHQITFEIVSIEELID